MTGHTSAAGWADGSRCKRLWTLPVRAARLIFGPVAVLTHWATLQNKIRCCEIMVDARQYDREFRCRICVYIGLNNCVAAALIPSKAVGNDVCVLAGKRKSLVPWLSC